MSEFLGEVRAFDSEPPDGWLPCDGRQLPINQNQALFALLGTSYGGDGRFKFALPKLAPIAKPGPGFYIAASPTIFRALSRNTRTPPSGSCSVTS